MNFLWTDENIEHINTRHNVSSDEVEEVFYNKPLYQISNSQPDTPKRYLAFGKTDAGRYLVIIFVRMKNGDVKPFSAREMNQNEKRTFKKQ